MVFQILAFKSTLLFVVKSSKSDDLAGLDPIFMGAYTANDNTL